MMIAARSRKGRTNARGEASRTRILDSADAVLRDRGYSGLSIAAVCDRADVAPTSVYWHFGSKAGLMEAVLARGGGHAERIRAVTARAKTPEARLAVLLEELRALVLEQPLGSLTGVAVVSEGRHATTELLDALRTARTRERSELAEAFAAEFDGAGPRPETWAIAATALTNYAALCSRTGGDEAEVDTVLAALEDLLRHAGTPANPRAD
ncbi:MAG: TetR/AcrR family transcriptional regulator [Myxococcota bacterium]